MDISSIPRCRVGSVEFLEQVHTSLHLQKQQSLQGHKWPMESSSNPQDNIKHNWHKDFYRSSDSLHVLHKLSESYSPLRSSAKPPRQGATQAHLGLLLSWFSSLAEVETDLYKLPATAHTIWCSPGNTKPSRSQSSKSNKCETHDFGQTQVLKVCCALCSSQAFTLSNPTQRYYKNHKISQIVVGESSTRLPSFS
jgi:hypothetical protein